MCLSGMLENGTLQPSKTGSSWFRVQLSRGKNCPKIWHRYFHRNRGDLQLRDYRIDRFWVDQLKHRVDLTRTLATIKSMTWFAKPQFQA